MKRASFLPVIAAVLAGGVIAGCGSSSKTSTTPASTPASPTAQSSGGSPSTSATKQVALITTKKAKLGTILAYGPKKLTVYLFEADKGGKSSCSGACASAWPPVVGKPKAGGAAKAAELGTTTRSDGTTQVTYRGHPLYRFIKDKDDGDAYGQGVKAFGASWYVLEPSGQKLDNS